MPARTSQIAAIDRRARRHDTNTRAGRPCQRQEKEIPMETPEIEARMALAIRNGLDRDGSLLLHLQRARHLWSGHHNHAEALPRLRVDDRVLEPHRFRAVAD